LTITFRNPFILTEFEAFLDLRLNFCSRDFVAPIQTKLYFTYMSSQPSIYSIFAQLYSIHITESEAK